MAAYKQFLAQDLIVTPFEVNKGFSFSQSEFGDSDVQIDRFQGTNVDFTTNKTTTGTLSTEYQALVYNSVKQLYYSNFLSSSAGSSVSVPELLPGYTPDGDTLIGSASSAGRYENYLQSTLTQDRFYPTGSGNGVAVFSIPSQLFGEYIQPESFRWEDITNNTTFTDDGNGNIVSASVNVGNIIYQHGLAILTKQDIGGNSPSDFVGAANVTCSFSSSYTIYETQYKATVRESEYNFSLNPTIISGSTDGSLYGFTSGSYFQPYVTTIGLYDDAQNLLAVGKLSQPYPLSRTTDTTFYINLDR
jgi:hypothetical protein